MKPLPGLRASSFCPIVVTAMLAGANTAAGQQPPPIHGVTGTIATETSVEETTATGNKVLGKIGRFFGLKRSASADAAAEEALSGLKKGTRIVLQYTAPGQSAAPAQHPTQVDAEVIAVNRSDRTVSITLADGAQQTLRLSAPGETDVANIIVYYKDRPGQRVARAFKRVS